MKNKMNTLFILIACSGLMLAQSCGVTGSGTQRAGENGRLKKFSVTLGGQNSSVGGFLNLSTGKVLTLPQASDDQKGVDLLYAYGRNTKMNLVTPASNRIRSLSKKYDKYVVNAWSVLNKGWLLNIRHGKTSRKIYKKAKNRTQLIEAYEDAKKMVKVFPDYKKSNNGPLRSIRHVEAGDIIVFRSMANGIYAIARVTGYKPGYSGNLSLDFKVSVK